MMVGDCHTSQQAEAVLCSYNTIFAYIPRWGFWRVDLQWFASTCHLPANRGHRLLPPNSSITDSTITASSCSHATQHYTPHKTAQYLPLSSNTCTLALSSTTCQWKFFNCFFPASKYTYARGGMKDERSHPGLSDVPRSRILIQVVLINMKRWIRRKTWWAQGL